LVTDRPNGEDTRWSLADLSWTVGVEADRLVDPVIETLRQLDADEPTTTRVAVAFDGSGIGRGAAERLARLLRLNTIGLHRHVGYKTAILTTAEADHRLGESPHLVSVARGTLVADAEYAIRTGEIDVHGLDPEPRRALDEELAGLRRRW